ncbi:MAG: MetQ/NlpA family ABC transporter substrate-binding protein [Corynebacterium sp.]|nr:MetQ/NlpA family ABC transporter substrate-binding protein [Corynebacterium sp.]MDN5720150.1 MetQ/NlpA family ABC transporter substrate-binding protein [Corynebacterium sp.]
MTRLKKVAALGTVAVVSAVGLTACMSDDSDADTITIGSTEANESQWKAFQQKAEEEGVNVEVKSITEYAQQNPALSNGDLDVNQFQHIQYLAEYNVSADDDLVPFGSSQIFPMGVYSKNLNTVEELEEAGEVIIPNDSTNGGRAILVLAQNGLVTLKDDDVLAPRPADIDEEKSKVKVTAVDPGQTAVAYNDGQASFINNNYLDSAGVNANDAVITDDPEAPEAQQYINVWVTTQKNKDNEDFQKLVEIWHSDEVQEAVQNDTDGTAIEVEKTPEELQEILADTEQKFRDQGTSDE